MVTVTPNWNATLRHPKMHPRIKFGMPFSNNIGDMARTQKFMINVAISSSGGSRGGSGG